MPTPAGEVGGPGEGGGGGGGGGRLINLACTDEGHCKSLLFVLLCIEFFA